MQNARDIELEAMSVQELLELQAAIHAAVRAAIREKNARKAAPAPTPTLRTPIDLERERDAWLAARRGGTPSGR